MILKQSLHWLRVLRQKVLRSKKARAGAWVLFMLGFLAAAAGASRWPFLTTAALLVFGIVGVLVWLESSLFFKAAVGFLVTAAIAGALGHETAEDQLAVCGFIMLAFGALQTLLEQIALRQKIKKRG